MPMNRNMLQVAIYLSALGLSAGMFLPLTSFPVYGEVSYYRIAPVEAVLVVVLALAAPALILAGLGRVSIVSPVGVWLVLLFPAIEDVLRERNSNALQQLGDGVTSAMTDFSTDLFMNIAEFHWGGLVFLVSLLVFTLTGLLYLFRR